MNDIIFLVVATLICVYCLYGNRWNPKYGSHDAIATISRAADLEEAVGLEMKGHTTWEFMEEQAGIQKRELVATMWRVCFMGFWFLFWLFWGAVGIAFIARILWKS